MNPKSGRTIPLYFKVSPEEKELIDKKMEQLSTHNQRAYEEDIADLKTRYGELWGAFGSLLSKLEDL